MNYLLHLLIYFDIYIIVALSLNLVVGYCGYLSLAHAGYYAIGGYSYALLSMKLGWEFVPAIIVGAVLSALLSLLISLPAWRLRGDFFVLVSLAIQALIFRTIYNWSSADSPLGSWQNLTNGPFGISGIPKPTLLGWEVNTNTSFTIFATALTLMCGFVLWRLTSSPWGRLLIAMRENELAARSLGKNTRLVKVQAFAISAALVSVAGALYASHVLYIDPSAASLNESILMLSMVIVGGLGNFKGPIIGAIVLIILPEVLRLLDLPDAQASNLRLLIYGSLLVLLMLFRPQGIAGVYKMQ
jgi:branched-chain amino acid transport system permease protein